MLRAQQERKNLPPLDGMLKTFRERFSVTCSSQGLEPTIESLHQFDKEDLLNVALDLVSALRSLPGIRNLPSPNRQKNLLSDILKLNNVVSSDDFDIDILLPLLQAVLKGEPDDSIWDTIYSTVTLSTPSPKPTPFLNQTPLLHTTSSFVNSSEHRKHVDAVLKEELGSIYTDISNFHDVFFGGIEGLETATESIMNLCREGDRPVYDDDNGWVDWPRSAQEGDVLRWLTGKFDMFRDHLMRDHNIYGSVHERRILARPSQPLEGSVARRKLDVAIVSSLAGSSSQRAHWSDVLIPGELKSNGDLDTSSRTWRDLGRYVREVLSAQETRRYVLGFTLCGAKMRIWEFDRVGATASEAFDINRDGPKFVSVFVGYLLMNSTQLGYDPSIRKAADGTHCIEITRNGETERILLVELMKRAPCVAGRATTCWKASREGSETSPLLVVKDSWQYPERDEEGVLLQEALESGVVNVARHYFHETVEIDGHVDDISNVRQDLDLSSATFHRQNRPSPSTTEDEGPTKRGHVDHSSMNRKRSSRHMSSDTAHPSRKRNCSNSPTKHPSSAVQNRVHRRVIVQDYGKPLYRARSHVAMLAALRCCLEGYRSLYIRTGLLQGDISIGNLLMSDETSDSLSSGFLIDLDLAIREKRALPSGAWGKTGTRAFMPIGQLLGDKPSFMQGLESFFWVLFWVCLHYDGPSDRGRVIREFDEWNYVSMEELAKLKLGTISDDDIFASTMDKFAEYHKPLRGCVDDLRRAVFPNGRIRRKEDKNLFPRMLGILQHAEEDLKSAQTRN